MKSRRLASLLFVLMSLSVQSQTGAAKNQLPSSRTPGYETSQEQSPATTNLQAEQELQKGTALTRAGSFPEAIPHLLAARGRASNNYAASFNLALCYVATGQS